MTFSGSFHVAGMNALYLLPNVIMIFLLSWKFLKSVGNVKENWMKRHDRYFMPTFYAVLCKNLYKSFSGLYFVFF